MPFAITQNYRYSQLINVPETEEHFITLDTEDFLNVGLVAKADAPTTFKVFVSNDAENWILAYESPSAEQEYIGKINVPIRFVKLVSMPAGSNGDKVTLSISAKP